MAEIKTKVDPLPANPTNADLAKGITQLTSLNIEMHTCLENTHKTMMRNNTQVRGEIRKLVASNREGDGERKLIKDSIDNLNKAFGLVKNEKQRSPKPVALMSQFEVAAKLAGLLVPMGVLIIGLLKVIDATGPSIATGFTALYHFLIGH